MRPLALSPDASRLFAINTPDGRLEIFDVGPGGLTHTGSVAVGMEPIAAAARTNTEVWVVNHLSDSVSIVDVSGATPRVMRTLLVGDEPRDIVFAGPGGNRAFISAAHRGQNTPLHANIEAELTTPGIGRADVWVFDAANLDGNSPEPPLGGAPLTLLTLFGDTPRALAVTPDGAIVYAAVFHSGNQTTAIFEQAVCNGGASAAPCDLDGVTVPGGLPAGQAPGGLPAPNKNYQGITGPETGLVVKRNSDSDHWEDRLGRNWTNAVRFDLPDLDVFAIDANANPPVESAAFAHVGTILFNMIVNPTTSAVYVTNTEARNDERFAGPGNNASTVRGHLHEARITVIDGDTVMPRHLNKHIDYGRRPQPPEVSATSLATPLGMAVTSDGGTLYVAAFGSNKIGVFDTTQLERNAFVPTADDHIEIGGGPTGLVLDEARQRLYALTRFDNAVVVIDTQQRSELGRLPLFDAEPANVVAGRPFLYDARLSSGNGEASCASCHVFADFDGLAWDLGDPDDDVRPNPNPAVTAFSGQDFHPMKGPMTTQTLRGMANHGPMHWRGDRTGAYAAPNVEPDGGGFDEGAAFRAFNAAFAPLLGRDQGEIPDADMQAFAEFSLAVTLPPNPIRNLDNSLTPAQQRGLDFYNGPISDSFANCNGCHVLDPARGFFGSDGRTSFEVETQEFKIPHLRNMYQKVGMFGMPSLSLGEPGTHMGAQIRGFGYSHDGSIDTLLRFHRNQVLTIPGGDAQRRDIEAFMLAYDSNLAPIVGQQVTLTSTNAAAVAPRIALLISRAAAGECDLVVKGVVAGDARGWMRTSNGSFQSDRGGDPPLSDSDLRSRAAVSGQELTYTCVPPGTGQRSAIDRDDDGMLDGDDGPCPATPRTECRDGARTRFQLNATAGSERLVWKWLGGGIDRGDFGDPAGGETAYALCVYSGATPAALLLEMNVPPQGACADRPCWDARGDGFAYNDKQFARYGASRLRLKEMAAGRAKVLVNGAGSNLRLPTLTPAGMALPLTVQLNNSDGACWTVSYSTTVRNDGARVKART